jgi:peptide/nickel transport system substrate-binding protein
MTLKGFAATCLRGVRMTAFAALSGVMIQAAPIAAAEYGDIVFAIPTDINTTDPDRVSSGGDWNVLANVFESLYGRDASGQLTPELATAYTVSADGLVYDFTLREGVTFQNGDPLTADDVVFSWNRAIDPELKFNFASWAAGKIASAEATGPLQVRITLKAPTPTFVKDLKPFLPIVPKAYIESVGNDGFLAAPIGTGPYKLVSREVQKEVVLEANPTYWGGAPEVNQVKVVIVPDENTRLAMLTAGEADVITNVHPLLVPQINSTPGLKSLVVPALQENFLMFNPQSPVWDPKVREALNLAIDRDSLTRALYFDAAQPMNVWCLRGRELGCDDNLTGSSYDPTKAKQLLDEAGFDYNRPIRIYGISGRPQTKETVEGVASYLSAIGVKSEITLLEFGGYLAFKGAKEKDYSKHDLILYSYATWTDDPVGQRIRPIVGTGGQSSFYSIPEVDEKLAAVDAASEADRAARINDLMAYIDQEHLVIPLLSPNVIYGMSDKVSWQPPADLITPIMTTLSKPAN